jgi:similar to stage IV sporulation protein
MLRRIGELGIAVRDVQTEGELTVRFSVLRRDVASVEELTQSRGGRLRLLHFAGIFWPLYGLRKRYVLLFFLVLVLFLSLWLPTRVLFIQVEGNDTIPSNLILEAAQEAGIRFGASRRAVRSERTKNELLGAVPQLRWAGVNTYGCTAVISVRERKKTTQNQLPSFCNIVAACDGVITSCTATDGTLLCSTGQAVRKGQMLISGYMDCGQTIKATRAEGEIFANTRHLLEAVTPSTVCVRGQVQEKDTTYSLIIGKKRINFVKGSRISDASCVKMCLEYCLTLPGGYTLPVTLVKETVFVYDMKIQPRELASAEALLSDFARRYLYTQQVALTVQTAQETITEDNGVFRLSGCYGCTEMIGREQGDQIGEFHGKTD